MKWIAKILLGLYGWELDYKIPPQAQRCVMIAAPHTSNWDFYYTRLAFYLLEIPMRVTIKNFWTKFPFGLIIKPMGGLGIDRTGNSKKRGAKSYVEQMKDYFATHNRIAIVVTPEGTRNKNDHWRSGFYYTAIAAEVPIVFGYLDYENKVIGVGEEVLYPCGNFEKDFPKILAFYKNIKGRYPDKFALDARYIDML